MGCIRTYIGEDILLLSGWKRHSKEMVMCSRSSAFLTTIEVSPFTENAESAASGWGSLTAPSRTFILEKPFGHAMKASRGTYNSLTDTQYVDRLCIALDKYRICTSVRQSRVAQDDDGHTQITTVYRPPMDSRV